MTRKRSITPTMRYTDAQGHKRTMTWTQYVALSETADMWGNGLAHDRTGIRTRTAFALHEAGLVHLDGAYGRWTIKGITDLGREVLQAYEVIRQQSDQDNLAR